MLASGDGDVDPEGACRLEHPDLGCLAARLSGRRWTELGGAAGSYRPAEEAEHRVGGDRCLRVDISLEVELAEWCPEAHRAHAVLGQRPRLVGADDVGRAEGLDRAQPLDDRTTPGELSYADGECERQGREEAFRDIRDDEADGKAERVVKREAGGEPADRQEGEPDADRHQRDQPRDAPYLLLEWARFYANPLRQSGDATELGLHAGRHDQCLCLAADAGRAAEHDVAGVHERACRVEELGGAVDGLGLTRQGREVDVDGSFEQSRVDRNAVAFLENDHVARHEPDRVH